MKWACSPELTRRRRDFTSATTSTPAILPPQLRRKQTKSLLSICFAPNWCVFSLFCVHSSHSHHIHIYSVFPQDSSPVTVLPHLLKEMPPRSLLCLHCPPRRLPLSAATAYDRLPPTPHYSQPRMLPLS